MEPEMNQDINVLALVKGEERYVFLYTAEFKTDILRTLGRFAGNPDLSFTWYDAACLSQKVKGEAIPKKDILSDRFRDAPIVGDTWEEIG
jgi:hypothetical protein